MTPALDAALIGMWREEFDRAKCWRSPESEKAAMAALRLAYALGAEQAIHRQECLVSAMAHAAEQDQPGATRPDHHALARLGARCLVELDGIDGAVREFGRAGSAARESLAITSLQAARLALNLLPKTDTK